MITCSQKACRVTDREASFLASAQEEFHGSKLGSNVAAVLFKADIVALLATGDAIFQIFESI